jgi:hypothetical protein
MSHWASTYIGEEWINGLNDCWHFFRKVQKDHFGRDVPVVNIDALDSLSCARAISGHDERIYWVQAESPEEGDAVLMGRGKHPTHIGTWLDVDGGSVLHSIKNAGVVRQGLAALRRDGWNNITFYRHI